MKRSRFCQTTVVMPLILVLCLTFVYSEAGADEVGYSAAHYFAAAMLLVDVGASLGNGIALATGRPNRLNGYFGIAAGVISFGIVATGYAMTDDRDLRDRAALVFGTAGAMSLVIGAVTVHRSPTARESVAGISEVSFFPYLTMEVDRRCGMGIGARMMF
ncbi:MAG: hypothetical protein PHD74_08045 [Candidatus Krumholzibacteria bacterium]|nr:hypothetical protein [Candidatus Krumholzibacteria bacterium]